MMRPVRGKCQRGYGAVRFHPAPKPALWGGAFRITQRFDMAVLPKYGRNSYAENGRKEGESEKSGKSQKR